MGITLVDHLSKRLQPANNNCWICQRIHFFTLVLVGSKHAPNRSAGMDLWGGKGITTCSDSSRVYSGFCYQIKFFETQSREWLFTTFSITNDSLELKHARIDVKLKTIVFRNGISKTRGSFIEIVWFDCFFSKERYEIQRTKKVTAPTNSFQESC